MPYDLLNGTFFEDESEQMWDHILDKHADQAHRKVCELLAQTNADENGCMTFGCKTPRKVRFLSYRIKVYRFIACVLQDQRPSRDVVVRHRCANRLCIKPAHLEFGTAHDNWLDHLNHSAYGIDFDLL